MTMRELMTHSAGLGYVLNPSAPVDKLFIKEQVLNAAAPLQTMIDKLAKMPLLAQPGTRWAYSIRRRRAGLPRGEVVGTAVRGLPEDAPVRSARHEGHGVLRAEREGRPPRAAASRRPGRQARRAADDLPDDLDSPPAGPSGGGGLYSTADDYLRFAQMLLNGGEFGGRRYLSPRTVQMMRTNHLQAEPLKTVRAGTGWGLGVRVVMDAAAAGEAVSDGSFDWYRHRRHVVLGRSGERPEFVGMIQQWNGRTTAEIQGLSRNLVYQALIELRTKNEERRTKNEERRTTERSRRAS